MYKCIFVLWFWLSIFCTCTCFMSFQVFALLCLMFLVNMVLFVLLTWVCYLLLWKWHKWYAILCYFWVFFVVVIFVLLCVIFSVCWSYYAMSNLVFVFEFVNFWYTFFLTIFVEHHKTGLVVLLLVFFAVSKLIMGCKIVGLDFLDCFDFSNKKFCQKACFKVVKSCNKMVAY